MWRPLLVSSVLLLCTWLKSVGADDSVQTARTRSTERVSCGATTCHSRRRGTARATRTASSASRVGVPPLSMRSTPTAFAAWLAPSAAMRVAVAKHGTKGKSSSTAPSSVALASACRATRLPARACRRRQRSSLKPLSSTGQERTEETHQQSLFIFGVGYVATAIALTYLRKGWAVHGTCTDPRKVKSLGDQGIKAYIFDDWSGPMMQPEPLSALASATCVLSTVPPALQSGTDPVLVAHEAELRWAHSKGNLRWIGYLSSTGVYGDRGGGWVTEEDEPWPAAPRTKARLKAERSWLRLHERDGLPTHVFRLAGIYGPGRSALDAVARHSGDIRLAGSDDGTMVSRIHVSDIVGVLEASIERPQPGMVVNVADDLPSTRYETLAYGCKLLGFPRQDPDPAEKYVNRRGGGNKRVDNGKMHDLLAASGRPLIFPDYRVGLKALHEGDGRPFVESVDSIAPSENQSLSATPASSTISSAPAATPTTGVPGRGEQDGNSTAGVTASVTAELKTLSAQVGRLEATLDRVLAVLGEKESDAARGAAEITPPKGTGGDTNGSENLKKVLQEGGLPAGEGGVAS
ncbi:unnamed protein product [Scytosiphon promiscuus]